jgi:hypothetical protein
VPHAGKVFPLSGQTSLFSRCGVETSVGDYDQRFPIHLAAAEGQLVSLDFLMYSGADISIRDRWGCVLG